MEIRTYNESLTDDKVDSLAKSDCQTLMAHELYGMSKSTKAQALTYVGHIDFLNDSKRPRSLPLKLTATLLALFNGDSHHFS
jgi:hypothetical protein